MFASRFDQSRARRRRLRTRTQPLIALVPNIFTVMSLCAGLTSIRYALDARWELAVGFIILAGILDGLDGRSARLLKLQSNFGAQLDSLADFLSFGVAPAMLVYLWSLHQVRGFGWTLALLFATCCALRLARFNTELDDLCQRNRCERVLVDTGRDMAGVFIDYLNQRSLLNRGR